MIKNFLLDLIFPRFCLGCLAELNQKTASFICDKCLNNIVLNGIECHICGLRNAEGTCRRCRSRTCIKGLFAAGRYQDPVLREAINQLKYNSIESLKKPLAELAIKYLKKENLIDRLANSILTPIPLSWGRKLNRGFNQSEILAKELSQSLNCPVINLLKRQKFNAPQARIKDWKKRRENISSAFCLSKPAILISDINSPHIDIGYQYQYKKVTLVDDVATSGATLEEAARVLKKAGFREIYGLVVAKG